MRIFFFHNPRTLLTFLVWSCHEIKNLVLLWLDTAVDKEREQGVTHPPQSHAVPDGSGREGQMEAGFRPVGCTPTREDRASPLALYPCGYVPLPAPTMQNSIPPVLTVQASLPDSAMEGELHRCWRSSIPRMESSIPFPWRRMVRESVLPLLEGTCHTLGGWALLRWGFPCGCKSDTAARPEALLDCLWLLWNFLSAFSEGSTAQGKEGRAGLQVPGKAKLTFPVRPQANTEGRICLWTIHPSTSAVPGDSQASPKSHSFLPSFSLNLVSLAFTPSDRQPKKVICFLSLGKHRKCVQHSLRVVQTGADEGHIQGWYTHTYRIKNLTVLSQQLSKSALSLSPAHSNVWASLFSLTPAGDKVPRSCSGHACKPDKSLEFLFFGAECLWYRENWSTKQHIPNTLGDMYYLPVEWMNNSLNAGYCQILIL